MLLLLLVFEKFADCMKNGFTYRDDGITNCECVSCVDVFILPTLQPPRRPASTQMYWQQQPQCFPLLRNSQSPRRPKPFAIFLKPFHFYLSVCLSIWQAVPLPAQLADRALRLAQSLALSSASVRPVSHSVSSIDSPEEQAITHFKIHQAAVKNFAPKGSLLLPPCCPP